VPYVEEIKDSKWCWRNGRWHHTEFRNLCYPVSYL